MARFFGHDLASVRLHVSRTPRLLGARAFAAGEDIFVDPDRHAPDTVGGRQLIAHETVHVLQQRLGRVPVAPRARGWSLVDDPVLEEEADRLGWWAALGLDLEDVLASPTLPPAPEPRVLQCAIARASVPATLSELMTLAGEDPATSMAGRTGNTTHPQNARPPGYDIDVEPAGTQFRARLVVTAMPYEGDSTSHYLRAGIYETNLSFDGTEYAAQGQGDATNCLVPFPTPEIARRRVYYVMPAAIAESNRQAELEHCGDHLYAYQQTLEFVHDVLQRVAHSQPAVAASAAAARAIIQCRLLAEIPEARRRLGVDIQNWSNEFERLCDRSGDRDRQRWHTFGLQPINPGADTAGEVTYLTGALRDDGVGRVYVRFTPGTTEIGTHTTATIIQ